MTTGIIYTSDNGTKHDLGKLPTTTIIRWWGEQKTILSEMTARYNRHGWLGGRDAYQLACAKEYVKLEALEAELERREAVMQEQRAA